MEYHSLGKTGLEVSTLGFGSSPFGNVFGNTTLDDNRRAVSAAIDLEINFFDVSPYYGLTLAEERLGIALAPYRHKILLATKCGRYGLTEFDFSAKRIKAEFEKSLSRLKTDYVDLLQAHDIEFAPAEQVIQEALPAMRELQAKGKVRFIGITAYPLGLLKRVAEQVPVDTILSYCRYNLLNTDMEKDLAPFTRERGLGLINASPLMMGLLTDAGEPSWHLAPPSLKQAGRRAATVAAEHGINISTLALQFSLAHPSTACTLIGMSSADQVQANVRASERPLELELLKRVKEAIGNGFWTTWPSGLPENHDGESAEIVYVSHHVYHAFHTN